MAFQLTSAAFEAGKSIPRKCTGDGEDVSPPLHWTDPPAGTQSFALVCEDPDAPRGTFIHWVAFNIPADARELREGFPRQEKSPDGTMQGKNDFGRIGYNGPKPPPGKPHRYFFKLSALAQKLDLKPSATAQELAAAARKHVLGEAQLMGTYSR
jgi:Raf kinase inhibitor-like YbhB/YbcL family protein